MHLVPQRIPVIAWLKDRQLIIHLNYYCPSTLFCLVCLLQRVGWWFFCCTREHLLVSSVQCYYNCCSCTSFYTRVCFRMQLFHKAIKCVLPLLPLALFTLIVVSWPQVRDNRNDLMLGAVINCWCNYSQLCFKVVLKFHPQSAGVNCTQRFD